MAISRFFTDPADLKNIDWQIMSATYWCDTIQDPDRKRRRQAEFLAWQFFPWSLVSAIGVKTPSTAAVVHQLLQSAAHRPTVLVRPDWYY
jgi:hypothetical protein